MVLRCLPSLQVSAECKKLDLLESAPLNKSSQGSAIKELLYARKLLERAKKDPFTSKKKLHKLQVRELGLTYRLGQLAQGEKRASPDESLFNTLRTKASHWKKKQLSCKGVDLSEADLEKMRELTCYPKLAGFILNHRKYFDYFCKWSILNHLSVAVFVEFPATVAKIDSSNLKARIGAFGGNGLAFREEKGVKDVTLLFEGKPISILDGQRKIELSHHLTLTVDEIFKQFRRKNLIEGYLTYFEDGVTNWDPHEMGPYNGLTKKIERIDLNRADWHLQLRGKKFFSKEEASAYFGLPCDGKNWIVTVVASRSGHQLDTFGGHSFYRLLIPIGNGTYLYTFGFGKYAKKYPQNGLHAKGMLAQPSEATMEYPDNNEIYTHREKKEKHYSMSEEKGKAFLESVRQDIQDGWKGNLAFQILVENCTDSVVEKLRTYVGIRESELFDVEFMKLQPKGFLGVLAKILRKAPEWFRNAFFYCFLFFLGGYKKMVLIDSKNKKRIVSVFKTPPWKKTFHHPGLAWTAPCA